MLGGLLGGALLGSVFDKKKPAAAGFTAMPQNQILQRDFAYTPGQLPGAQQFSSNIATATPGMDKLNPVLQELLAVSNYNADMQRQNMFGDISDVMQRRRMGGSGPHMQALQELSQQLMQSQAMGNRAMAADVYGLGQQDRALSQRDFELQNQDVTRQMQYAMFRDQLLNDYMNWRSNLANQESMWRNQLSSGVSQNAAQLAQNQSLMNQQGRQNLWGTLGTLGGLWAGGFF